MKKFFKSMALSLVVAVFAICCLAGCGGKDEFKGGENATVTEIYEIASTANNEFGSGYSMYTVIKYGKRTYMEIDGQVVLGESDVQVAMTINMLGYAFGAYVRDGYAYLSTTEGKVKVALDTESEEYTTMISQIQKAMSNADIESDMLTFLEAYAAFEAMGESFKVKKLTSEDGLERFKIYTTQETEDGTADVEMVVGYKDGHIVEYSTKSTEGKEVMYSSIKALAADAEINYPADLDTYTEAV